MRRIRIQLDYDGTDFPGWQVQPGLLTIQGTLESVVGEIEGRPVHVAGSGRTDAGVHALAQVASPKSGLLNLPLRAMEIDWRFNIYSMSGLIVIYGIYYAPYVYMFTASALRNMDPALEEAAEISGATPIKTLFTVTF